MVRSARSRSIGASAGPSSRSPTEPTELPGTELTELPGDVPFRLRRQARPLVPRASRCQQQRHRFRLDPVLPDMARSEGRPPHAGSLTPRRVDRREDRCALRHVGR